MSAMRYDGTMLMTEQFDACREFYRDLLGVDAEAGAGWANFPLGDGTFVGTTYGYWTAGASPYIVSTRFTLKELDRLSRLAR